MKCDCGGRVLVKDSRSISEGIWRQRQCDTCKRTFTTLEQLCVTLSVVRGLKDEGHGTARIKLVRPETAIINKPSAKTRKKTKQAPIPKPMAPLVVPVEPAAPKARHLVEDRLWEKKNDTLFDDC